MLLFSRYIKDNMRNPSIMRAKFVQKLVMGLFLGSLYFRPINDQVECVKIIVVLSFRKFVAVSLIEYSSFCNRHFCQRTSLL